MAENQERRIAEQVKLNLGNNIVQTFDIWIDAEGKLEIVPFNRLGDIEDWSYVLGLDRDNEYTLYSRQLDNGEENY